MTTAFRCDRCGQFHGGKPARRLRHHNTDRPAGDPRFDDLCEDCFGEYERFMTGDSPDDDRLDAAYMALLAGASADAEHDGGWIQAERETAEAVSEAIVLPEDDGRPGILGVDFDGTLTDGLAAYWDGETEQPDGAVIEAVRRRYYAGWCVVVWTARPWSEASTIAARLTEWGVPYHGIRCEKGAADEYVDDKATPVEWFDG